MIVATLLTACGTTIAEEAKALQGPVAVPVAQVAEDPKGPEEPEALTDEPTFVPPPKAAEKPDFQLTVVQYWFPYNKDESAADAKFRDKSILLSGPMVEVSADSEPAYLVVRGANAKQLVKCTFDPQTVPDNLSRYKERKVKVLGLGDGKSEEYVHLRGCSVFEVIISGN